MTDTSLIKAKLYLLQHSGYKKSKELEEELGVSGSIIRDVVREMREQGVPITSDQNGYGYAKDIDELRPTLDHLRKRALSMLRTIRKLENNFVTPNSQNSLFYRSVVDEIIEEIRRAS